MKNLVPALKGKRGNIIKGVAGQRHDELYPEYCEGNWVRGFWHPHHGFLSRNEASRLFGVWDSEDLRKLLSIED